MTVLFSCAVAAAILGCGASSGQALTGSAEAPESEVRAAPWHVARVRAHRLEFLVKASYCEFSSSPMPTIRGAHVEPRGRRLVITVNISAPVGSRPKELVGCPGAGTVLRGTLHTPRFLRSHVLVDGATRPHTVRWQPPTR